MRVRVELQQEPYLDELADKHRRVALGLGQDTLGDDLAVVKGLSGKPHLGQATRVDELEHL